MRDEIDARMTASGLAAAYRRRRPLSPVDVVEEYLDRLTRFDTEVRSINTITADLARRQARAAARRLAEGDPSPLLGVPVVVKDLIDVQGVRTTAGSAVLADNVASRSAPVWQRLRAAGAVLLGKANTHEFAYGGTTEPTVNPWHHGHLVGGSSGGPAAALAAGLAAVAIGTDTAGSIRIPANLCGVAGLKPTSGSVSARGVIPLAPSLDVVGPLAHHPRDLALALDAIRITRWDNGVMTRAMASARRRATARRLRFGAIGATSAMSGAVAAAFERTQKIAEQFGSVEQYTVEGFDLSVFDNFTILGVEAALIHRQWRDRRELYTPYVRERLAEAETTRAIDHLDAQAAGRRLRRSLDELADRFDAVIVPGLPFAAPPLGATSVDLGGSIEDRDTGMCRNTAFANLTGHPVLALPVGFDRGLPVGVQVMARRGGDAHLLAIGALIADELATPTIAPAYAAW